jgi:hypothetical protein
MPNIGLFSGAIISLHNWKYVILWLLQRTWYFRQFRPSSAAAFQQGM